MKNNSTVLVVVAIVAVLAVGYLGRHQIKSMLGYGTPPVTTSPATTTDIVTTRTDPNKGNYLAAGTGMTLYVFDKDTVGVSNCTGGCALVWPAYTVGASQQPTLPANVTTFKRADGATQYAYNGRPLYFYQPDQKVGDVLGDGVNGTWHLVKP